MVTETVHTCLYWSLKSYNVWRNAVHSLQKTPNINISSSFTGPQLSTCKFKNSPVKLKSSTFITGYFCKKFHFDRVCDLWGMQTVKFCFNNPVALTKAQRSSKRCTDTCSGTGSRQGGYHARFEETQYHVYSLPNNPNVMVRFGQISVHINHLPLNRK